MKPTAITHTFHTLDFAALFRGARKYYNRMVAGIRALLQASPFLQDLAPDLDEWKLSVFSRPDYTTWAQKHRVHCKTAVTAQFESAVQNAKEKVYMQIVEQQRIANQRVMDQNAQLIDLNKRTEAFYIRQLCVQRPGNLTQWFARAHTMERAVHGCSQFVFFQWNNSARTNKDQKFQSSAKGRSNPREGGHQK